MKWCRRKLLIMKLLHAIRTKQVPYLVSYLGTGRLVFGTAELPIFPQLKIMLPISLGTRSRAIAPIIDIRELGAEAGAAWKLAGR
jgi:hypothetical protein